MEAEVEGCFLCRPDPGLVYASSPNFFAMLGWGPLGEGYSLVATSEHLPSMFDLGADEARELTAFCGDVRARLAAYGPAVITEHGRVAACVAAATRAHEPHCLHAHRLVFPGRATLALDRAPAGLVWEEYDSFEAARASFDWPGQYLYVEAADSGCRIARASRAVPRQLFRRLVAQEMGRPELADWRRGPQASELAAARAKMRLL